MFDMDDATRGADAAIGLPEYTSSICLLLPLFHNNTLEFMVLNATFNNISVTCISWQSVLFVEETGIQGENHRPVTSY